MAHDVLVHAEDPDAVEPGRIIDQDPSVFGELGVVGGVPRDPAALGDSDDGEALNYQRLQRLPQPTT